MSNELVPTERPWGLATEKFFYFFMGLRKGEIRKQLSMMKARYPDDDPHRLARRFVAEQVPLSLLGGTLMHAPMLLPAAGPALKLLGVGTGASVVIRLNMTLLMQIALIFGHDIDDRARLKEMMAIIAASGAAGGTTLLPHLFGLAPSYKGLLGGAAVLATSQLIGEVAIKYYGRGVKEPTKARTQVAAVSA